jgi:hypothetical protein
VRALSAFLVATAVSVVSVCVASAMKSVPINPWTKMQKFFSFVLVLTAFSFAVSGADAASTLTVSQSSGLLTKMCGQYIQGCVWCVNKSGNCYRVTGCSNGTCTIERFDQPVIPKGTTGTEQLPKPILAPAPPPKGTNPVTAAPIINGKPVEASPTEPSHPVILEKGSGGSGKH